MNLWEQYSKNYKQIRKLTEVNSDLKKRLIGYIVRDGGDPVRKPFGTFSITDVSTYSYSQKVTALHERMLALMEQERESGVAKKLEKKALRFQSK